jgi:hypothetical protein
MPFGLIERLGLPFAGSFGTTFGLVKSFGLAFGFTGIGAGVDFLRATGFGLDVGFIVISLLDERFVLLCE